MYHDSGVTVYCADWVVPVCSNPIQNGAVAIHGADILELGPRAPVLETFPEAEIHEFGESAILPGLINCHSHLELTAMRGFLEQEEGNFFAWLKKLTIARRDRMNEEDVRDSAILGAVEAARAGVTCVGDASDNAKVVMDALRGVGLRGTVYQESFGPDPAYAQENLEKLREKISEMRGREGGLLCTGISPHAPYTVSARQLETISELALADKLPLMIHAAESMDELNFLRDGTGVFADDRTRRGIPWEAPGLSPIKYLERCGILRTRPLLAHCVQVDSDDIETIQATEARIAHCPKSNAKLGHGRAPLAAFLDNEIAVGLGSDSVAGNNICDILEEARIAALISRSSGETLMDGRMIGAAEALYAATIGGARALGMADRLGSLAQGRQADLTIISLKNPHQLPVYNAISAVVFSSSGQDVIRTIVAGREIYYEGKMLTVDENRLKIRMDEIKRKLSS